MKNTPKNRFPLLVFVVFALSGISACTKNTAPTPQSGAPASSTVKVSDLDRAMDAVKKNPNFENYTQLGLIQLNRQDAANALQSFTSAAEKNPNSSIAHNNLCATYNTLRKWSAAQEECQKALTIEPAMQLAKNNLAAAEAGQKRAADELAALEKKAKGSNPDANTLLQLGMAYYDRADYSKAISTWKKIGKDQKVWATAQNNIGSAAILSRNFTMAKEALESALAAEPNNQLVKNNLNWLARAQKE